MDFPAVVKNGLTDVLDHGRQFVGPDVGVRFTENIRLGAVIHQNTQCFVDASALDGAGIELAIGIRAGAAFPETIVRMRINVPKLLDGTQIASAGLDILATIQHNGLNTRLQQLQSCKITGRPSAHDDHFPGIGDRL